MDADHQQALLDSMPASDRVMVGQALGYPEDGSGRLMCREYVAILAFWTVGEVIDCMRSGGDLPDTFYGIYAVGPGHKALGVVMTSRLLRSQRAVPVHENLAA